MRLDLLDFTKNPACAKMVHYKGISAAQAKTIITVALLPLPFGFFINRCMQPAIFTHDYSRDYTFLLLFVLAISAYSFKRYAMPLINQYRSKTWERVRANIVEIGIFEVKFPVLHSSLYVTSHFPALIYEYEVGHQKYQNRRLSFASDYVHNPELDEWSSNRHHEMNELFSKWVEEQRLNIYYNPKKPKESVVIRKFHPARKVFFMTLGALSAIALFASIYNLLCYVYWITA
jgi:hypothetical protein